MPIQMDYAVEPKKTFFLARQPVLGNQKLLYDFSTDQMLLDNPFEDGRIAFGVPGSFGIDDRDGTRRCKFAGNSPWSDRRRLVRLGPIPPAVFGDIPTPRATVPSRSISASFDHSTEKYAF